MLNEKVKLPDHYEIEAELREQLSGRPGHQRCVVGHDELLLILHEVPKAGVPEREAIFFWRRGDGRWLQPGGPGLDELCLLLERYAKAIDANEEILEVTESTEQVFEILRHAGPLARSTRNIVQALEQALAQEPDDKEVRASRDRARELERAAELLQSDARETLMFWQAEAAEAHTKSSERLGNILFKLNLVTGFFLPLVALGGLFGMNVDLPEFVQDKFWWIFFGGLIVGGLLLRYVSKGNK
ncbi:CorA family divalent cation transporter [Luteolibacter algae]|uniref:CorA family divalent cation transporter n=1 Tax=Luteolibacter algae TaxID=454151 RepID=A0ABW5D689_9BACT